MLLCTICARAGSKGVKNKNIKELCGKPLIAYSIEQARLCGLFSHIVLSTDSDEIARIGQKFGAEVFFKRSAELSNDSAGKVPVIRDALLKSQEHFGKKFDYIIDLDVSSPLRLVSDIKEAFGYFQAKNYDNLISVSPSRKNPYFNIVELDDKANAVLSKPLENHILSRQSAPKTYDANGSIYIWKNEALLSGDSVFLANTGIYVMSEENSYDIDSELDFLFVEFLMKRRLNSRI